MKSALSRADRAAGIYLTPKSGPRSPTSKCCTRMVCGPAGRPRLEVLGASATCTSSRTGCGSFAAFSFPSLLLLFSGGGAHCPRSTAEVKKAAFPRPCHLNVGVACPTAGIPPFICRVVPADGVPTAGAGGGTVARWVARGGVVVKVV